MAEYATVFADNGIIGPTEISEHYLCDLGTTSINNCFSYKEKGSIINHI